MDKLADCLDAFERACALPCNIPEMQSWQGRKDSAREAAAMALESTFTPGQLRSLYDLTSHMLADELAAEQE